MEDTLSCALDVVVSLVCMYLVFFLSLGVFVFDNAVSPLICLLST